MKTQKKQKQFKLTSEQSKLLFNFNEANLNKKAFTKLTAELKEPAVTIVEANGGQVFTTYKGHNVHAQTKYKEYFTFDHKKFEEDHPELYKKYKVKAVSSVTLEVNTSKK